MGNPPPPRVYILGATIMTGRHVLRYGLQNTVIWPQDAWSL